MLDVSSNFPNMPYIPSHILWQKLHSLLQGFFIAEDPKYVICIKLEPTLINSIIEGCLIEIGLIKDYYGKRLTMLLIEDIPGQPFFVVGKEFSSESKEFNNYDKIIIDLFNQEEIILGLFNLDSMPVYSKILKPDKSKTKDQFSKWLKEATSQHKNLRIFDQKDIFTINLNNYVDKKEDKSMTILKLEPFADKRGETEFITTIENQTTEGKHGYSQEYSIRNFLLQNFEINKVYFESPVKANGEEITDSILFLDNCVLLIESKFVISQKQNKKNQALKKAILQLKNSKLYLAENGLNGVKLDSKREIIEICIVDTKFIHFLNKFPDEIISQNSLLPIVFTVSSFTQFIGSYIIEHGKNFIPYFEEELLAIWKDRKINKLTVINPV